MEGHAALERQQLWGLKALSGDDFESVNHCYMVVLAS